MMVNVNKLLKKNKAYVYYIFLFSKMIFYILYGIALYLLAKITKKKGNKKDVCSSFVKIVSVHLLPTTFSN